MIETFPPASVMPPNDSMSLTVQCLPYKVTEVPKSLLKTYPHTKRVGNYLLGRTLGEGSFAKVKEGLHILTGEKVAVKIIDKKKAKEDAYVRKNLRREGKLLQMVRHSHVVQLDEIMETENCYYLVTELCEGGDLMDYICNKRRLEEKETRKFLRQIISAVDYLHKAGIVHRDLKIENLLLDENKDIKIIDFGLSNCVRTVNTNTGGQMLEYCVTQCGSPAYAAPELLSNKKYGPKVDIWSIGVNMYAMLTGNLPFTVEPFNIKALHTKMLNADMNPFPSHLSAGCKDLLKKFLTPDPESRISLSEAMRHPWINEGKSHMMEPAPFPNKLRTEDLHQDILRHMSEHMDHKISEIIRMTSNNTPSNISATYRLLYKRLSRYNAEMRVKGRVAASDARILADNKPGAFTHKRDEESPKVTAAELIDLIPIQHRDKFVRTNNTHLVRASVTQPVRTSVTHSVRTNTTQAVQNNNAQEAWNVNMGKPELINSINDKLNKTDPRTQEVKQTASTIQNTHTCNVTAKMNAYRLSKRKTEMKKMNCNSDGPGVTTDTFKRKQTNGRHDNTVEEKLFTLSSEGVRKREEINHRNRKSVNLENENRMVTKATPLVVLHKRIAEVAEETKGTDIDNQNKLLEQENPQHDLPEIVRKYSCRKENGSDEVVKEDVKNVENSNNDDRQNLYLMNECQNAIRRKNMANSTRSRKLRSGLVRTANSTTYGGPNNGSLDRAKTLPLDCSLSLKYAADQHTTKMSVKSLTKQERKVVDISLYDRYARKSIKALPSVFNCEKTVNGKRSSDAAFTLTKRAPTTTDISPLKKTNSRAEENKRDLCEQAHTESRDSGIVCNMGAERSNKLTLLRRSPIENSLPNKPSNEITANTQIDSECRNLTSDDQSETSVTAKYSNIVLPTILSPLAYR